MTHSEPKPVAPLDVVRERVRALRRGRYTADQLAERLQAVGVKWDRNVVASFETGRRKTLAVEELLALALILDVAPVNLLVPLEDDRLYRYVPAHHTYAGWVRKWVRGESWIDHDGGDPRRYYTEVPADEWSPPERRKHRRRDVPDLDDPEG